MVPHNEQESVKRAPGDVSLGVARDSCVVGRGHFPRAVDPGDKQPLDGVAPLGRLIFAEIEGFRGLLYFGGSRPTPLPWQGPSFLARCAQP